THHRSEVVIFLRATALGNDGAMADAQSPLPDSPNSPNSGSALSGAPLTGSPASVPSPSSPI
ncbi:MAG: hypothetical protein LC772_05190, partial [Chloroflexi bacterium]|nr:hypothetical protein [Chloroflexota bacterium]